MEFNREAIREALRKAGFAIVGPVGPRWRRVADGATFDESCLAMFEHDYPAHVEHVETDLRKVIESGKWGCEIRVEHLAHGYKVTVESFDKPKGARP